MIARLIRCPPGHTQPASPFTDSNNFNARSLARAASIISRPWKASSKRPGSFMPVFRRLSKAPFSAPFNGVSGLFVVVVVATMPISFLEVVGRLDHLVEAVYERFKDRYFEGERAYRRLPCPLFHLTPHPRQVFTWISKATGISRPCPPPPSSFFLINFCLRFQRFWARIAKVYPPYVPKGASSTPSGSASPPPEEDTEPHRISGDLKIPASEVNAADDPKGYYYKVQLSEDGNLFDDDLKGKGKTGRFAGSFMDVQCECMRFFVCLRTGMHDALTLSSLSRDRLSFSKSILRRFIRDCVDRDAAVASPWTVKQSIAEKYSVENVMPEATRKGVEDVKNKEIEKRKKVWEDKEGPPSKKHKKVEEKGKLSFPAACHFEAFMSAAKAKEEEQRTKEAAMEMVSAKKKYIKYPTEDLDVVLSQREKTKRLAANGHTRSVRPEPLRDLPFEGPFFESMLMVWSFFMAFGLAPALPRLFLC